MVEKKTLTERVQRVEDALYDCNGRKGILSIVTELRDYIIVQKAFKKKRKWIIEVVGVVIIAGIMGLLTQIARLLL